MQHFFLRIFDYLQHKRHLCYALVIATMAVLIALTATLKYNENVFDFLPISGNEQKALTLYQDISGGQRVFVLFKSKDSTATDIDHVTAAVDAFVENMQASPEYGQHIREMASQVDFDKVAGMTDFVYQNMPLLLCDTDYARMDSLLERKSFADEQLANDIEAMMAPTSGLVSANIEKDPLGLFAPVIERLQARLTSMPVEIDNGYFLIPGTPYAVVMLTSPYGAMESANNSRLVSYVDSVVAETRKTAHGVSIDITGSPVIAVDNANQIRTDSQWAISIAVTLIMLLLVYSFHRVKNLLLIGLSIFFGWLFAMGLMAVLKSEVSLIVLGIGSVIIGIAVNYPLHFIAHSCHGGHARVVLKEMVAPLLIGNITTVGAFASLVPLDAPALRDLGFFAAFMLVGTILFVLIFLPHLISKRVAAQEEKLLFGRVTTLAVGQHRWMLWALFLPTLVFGYFSLKTSFDTNIQNINFLTDRQKCLLNDLSTIGGLSDTTNVYVVTEGDTWDEALQERTRIAPLLDSLKQNGLFTYNSDVTTFICSEQEQQRRIDQWNGFWAKHKDSVVRSLQTHAPRYGFHERAFEGFERILAATYSPQPFEHFEPLKSIILNNAFSTSTGKHSVVDVIDSKGYHLQEIKNTLNKEMGEDGYAFDFVGMNSAIANALSDNFNYIGIVCSLVVFLFLWLSFGRLELSLLAFLPMAMGWLWILGIMYLAGMQFNIVNVILATFIFGQGDDYTIFITEGLIDEYAYDKKILPSFKNSIIISALIMFIGMGALIVAKHPALHSLAEVTIVGMFTVVLMAWIVPSLIFEWIVKRNNAVRHVPVTIEQMVRAGWGAAILLIEAGMAVPLALYARLIPWRKKAHERLLHQLIYRLLRADIHHIWGAKTFIRNEHEEDFSQPAIILCRQQSVLDPLFIRALSPNVALRDVSAMNDGYSVVCHSAEEALLLAQQTGADILPVYLHGTGHIMPKGCWLAARGQVVVEVGKRISQEQLQSMGDHPQTTAGHLQQMYRSHEEEMRKSLEDAHYFHHYVIYKYMYKGFELERETRRLLRKHHDFSSIIDSYQPEDSSSKTVHILHAGHGQFSLLFALAHPELEVKSYCSDRDDWALASNCHPLPANLQVVLATEQEIDSLGSPNQIVWQKY